MTGPPPWDAAVQHGDGSMSLLATTTASVHLVAGAADRAIAHQATASDGRLAWASAAPIGDELEHAVVLHEPNGPTQSHVVVFGAFYLSWQPGGGAIATLGNGPLGLELTVIDAGSGEQRIVTRGAPLFFDWCPTLPVAGGTARLAAHVGPRGDDRLVVFDDGKEIDCPISPGIFTAPQWHPDGTRVMAVLDDNTLAWWEPDTGETVPVTPAPGPSRFGLSPDGRHLWLTSADHHLLVFDVERAVETTIHSDPPVAASWSPDGTSLLLVEAGVVNGHARLRHAVWRYGEMVHRSEWFVPTSTDARHHLPFPEQYARSSTPWLHDSTAFVWAGTTPDGRAGVRIERVGVGAQWLCAGERVVALGATRANVAG
jgi:hypothetical protein